MKKNLKRWLALLLAIAMVVTSGAFTNLTYLRATDSETPVETQSEKKEEKQEAKTEEKEKEKEQKVVVEPKKDESASKEEKKEDSSNKEETKEEKKEDAASEKKDEATVSGEKKQDTASEEKKEDSTSSEKKEEVSAETKTEAPSKDDATVAPAEAEQTPAQSQVEEPAPTESKTEEAEAKTYEVKVEKPDADGGSVKAWSDGNKADVSNGGTQTVKEGETFYLQIATKEGYSVEKVTDQDGKTIDAKDIKDNTYSYELNDVKENKTLNISYKEEKQDEVTYPAFSHKGSKDGVTANISAPEGVFPEGTTVELKALSADDRAAIAAAAGCETSDVLGLDITFKYEGKEIQPTGDVKVSFSADEIKDADEASVYHVNDSGSVDKIGGSKDGASVGFTADSFSPYGVALQKNDDVSTTALSGGNTVKVGEWLTLTGTKHSCAWGYHYENWSSSNNAYATVTDGGVVRGIKPGTVTITHTYCTSGNYGYSSKHQQTESITVTVTPKILASGVSLTGADTVKAYDKITLTPEFTPEGASAVLSWQSSNTSILTVDENGVVTGVAEGETTVIVRAQGADGKTISAEKPITVTAATESTDDAQFYFLKSPTSDPDSNASDQWGTNLGSGKVTTASATWSNDKNITSNVAGRIIAWPSGYENGIVPKTSSAWQTIFNSYKQELQKNLSYELKEEDVLSIVLIPHKISKNNGTNPDKHVDCRVRVITKGVHTALYLVQDPGKTDYSQKESQTKKDGDTTAPTGEYPTQKVVNGVTYTFSGWYTNENLTGTEVTFETPYVLNEDVIFYARYTAGHYVRYNLNGGSWSNSGTSSSYFTNEGTMVYVVNDVPTREGYTFLGWKSSETTEDGALLNKDSAPFSMPDHDVTLTAQWEPNEAEYTVNYYWNNTTEHVLDSKTVSGHKVDENVTESPVTVNGYTVVSNAEQTITLSTNASQNVINFYYYKNVTLTANSDTVTYAGTKQSVSGFTSSENAADFGTITVGAKGTDAGAYDAVFAEGTVGTVDATKKYIVASAINGKLTINPATLTIKTPTATKTYDGTPLTAPGTIDGFVNGETAIFETTGSQTEVGSSDNSYALTWDGTAKESNYTVSATVGKLAVKESEAEITVKTTGGIFTYDGKEHGATVEVIGLPKGYKTETATSNAKATDVTEGVKATCDTLVIKNAAGVDVTDKLNIKKVDGTIVINKAPLTVVTPSDSKVYDGEALMKAGGIKGLVNGETVTFTTTGSQTEVGSSPNNYEITWDGTAKESNYTVNETIGTLTVTETTAEIVVTTTGGKFTYDGKAHGATVTVSELPKGYRLETATSNATATNVTTKDVKATCDTLVIRNKSGEDVTNKLNIRKVDGTIKITPATLTVVTPDANKAYDGTALTAAGTIRGFVNGETADFATTGTQTNVGKSKNTYKITWNGTAKESNYTVSESVGTLEVTQGTITDYVTLTPQNVTKTYDGQPLAAGTAVARDRNGNALTVEYQKADGNWTTDRSEITATDVADTKTVNVRVSAANYDGYVTAAETVTITPATLTVKTPDANKVYDGTPLTKEGTISGFVNGEEATFKTTGSQITVGESDNTYTITWDKTAKEGNYTVSATVGKLNVTESTAKITVTTTGGEFTYNGKAHGATVQVTGVPAGYTVEKATSSASATDVTETAVTATCDTLVIKNAQGEDVTAKLNIERVDGKITVIPATLTVVTPNGSKVYDGKALTKAGEISGFVNNETATFTTTGSQTEVGSSPNSYEITWDGTAKKSNYTVKETVGTLTVTETAEEIVVTTTGGEFTYDGKAHGATVTVTGLPEGYRLEKAASSATATDVTTEDVKATCDTLIIKNASGKDVTASLKITKVDGKIKITPATLTVVTPDANKAYDGKALTAAGTINGFVNGETADFATTGTQTNVGESKNTYKITWNGTAKESNYTVSESVGTLKVTQGTITDYVTLTPQNVTKTYDGQPLVAGTAVARDRNENALTIEYQKADGNWTTDPSEITATDVADTKTVNVRVSAANYDGYVTAAETVTITPATLTVTTPNASKVYDGMPLTKEGTISGFVNGEEATFKTTGSQITVGESDNTYTITWDKTAKEGNYTVSATVGKLKVTESTAKITVTTTGGEFTYDGTAHGATVQVAGVPAGYTVETATSSASATDVTETAVTATCDTLVIKNAQGEDVTAKLNIERVDGKITVTPATLTVVTPNGSKVYDGKALTKAGEIKGFVNGETATFATTGSQTEVGSSPNSYEITWDGTAKKSNYTVKETVGTLTVTETAEEIVVTTTGGEFTYDGTAHGATVTVTGLPEGYTLEKATSSATATDVTTEDVKATCDTLIIKNASGKDVTASLKITKVDGKIKINPATLTVTTPSANKAYDGTALTAAGMINGFVNGETAGFATTGSQTNVGKSKNTYKITWNGTAKESNYTVSESVGTLEVTKGTIADYVTLTPQDVTKTYDGQPLSAGIAKAEDSNGNALTVEYQKADGSWTTDPSEITATNVDDTKDIHVRVSSEANYAGYVYGTQKLEITKRSVILRSETASKTYDGTALTKPEVTVTGDGFVDGEVSDIKANGSVTYVEEGEVTNNITYTAGDNFKESNYEITKEEGKLHIEAITTQITVTAQSDEKVYDGTPLTKQGVTYTANVLLDGDSLVATVSGSQTDAGSSANVVTSVKVMRGDQDVTANYTFGERKNGTLKVTPRKIELTSGSAEKTYDGTPLTKNEVTVTAGSFVDGEGFDYDVTGSQTYAGNSANTFTYAAKEGTKLTNYEVTTKYGTLNVKLSADEITIKAPSASKMYDGTPLTLTSGATYTGKLADGDVLRVTLTGSQTDFGSSAVTVAGYRVIRMVDGAETDVTANYKFGQSIPGTVSVTKRKVTLTSASDKKTYDGTPLTNDTVTVSGDGFVAGEGAAYSVTGSQLDAGKSENTFSYTLNANTNPANYEIETVKGDLIVDPIKEQTITITANSASKTYDGTPLTDNGYTYTEGVLVNGDVLTAVVEGSVTNVDDADNSNVVTSYKVMRGGTDVTKNYTFTASVNGTLTINPRSITLTSATDEKPYDGTPLTNATITVSDPGFVAGEGATYDVTGTQTLVGSSENTFTYELNEGTRKANYVIETVFGKLTVSDDDVDPTTVVTKTHADKADGGRYDLGETVTFTITVKNPYDTAKTITLTEQGGVTLKDTVFENVAPGATVSTTATYTITEADVKAGTYHNEVTAAFSGGKSFTGEDTVEVEDGKAHLTVIKVASTTQPEGGFKLGDTIEYSIKVKNDGNLTVSNIEVTDDLTGDVLNFGTLAGHTESEPQTVSYTVTEKDILSGKIINNATVTKAEDPDGNTPETTPGKAEVTPEPARPVLIVNKTVVGKTGGYELGEKATYTISVTNAGNVTVKNVWVTDDLTGQRLFFGTIAPGETVPAPENPTQITYTITEQDILNGKVVNVATVTKAEPAGGTLETAPGTATITTVSPAPSMKINKRTTSTAPKGGYKVGDTITYAISVTNTGNVTLTDVKVSDPLTGNVDSKVLDFGTIAPKTTSDEITVSYVVTEADVSRGKVINEATGTATDPKGNEPEVTPGKTVDETEPKNSHITVTKKTTSTMPEGGYKLGDTITYKITVKNDGNQTLTNVQITDDLAGLVKDVPADWTIASLGINESKTVTAQYVVTEADIRNGKVINDATVKGAKDPDDEDPIITPGKTEDDTEPKNSHITVTKKAVSTPKDPAGYGLGEEIKYEITVKNDGNQTLTNVVVADSLADIVKDVPADWTIPTLAVGDEVTVTATYTVTEADIRAGKVHNEATISELTDPDGPVDPDPTDPEKPKPVTPGTDDQPTVKEESSLFISKTADQTSGLKAGDVVTYTILVVNNGNQTIKDIVVKDDLTGDSFDGKILGLGGITLKPGESKEFTVRYTITETDVIRGSVNNVATVTGTDPNNSQIEEKAEEKVDTQTANPNYTVTKTVDNPQAEYKVGDVINYTIRVTNTGNLTLNNLVVKDQMQGTNGAVVIAAKGVTINGTIATIEKLAVGASIELKASYTVVRADADSALSNKVNVTTTDKPGTDPKDPDAPDVPDKEDKTDPTPTEKTYVLTIHYVDANGNVLAPDFTARLLAGETIDAVVSPTINGYTPNFATVGLPATGMPARDVVVTVVYTANPVVVPDDPRQPNNPNNPNPNNGGGGNEVNNNGGNNPAVPATPADNTPADGVIQPNDDGGYDLTPVEDGQTPLANMDLDDHACCILHFLIMLLTLIIFAIYTKSRKNRQMKVEELREQLAIATIQKELDLSDEDMAKYLEEAKKLAEEKKQANA